MTRSTVSDHESDEGSEKSEMCFAQVNASYSSVISGTRSDLINLLDNRSLLPLFFANFTSLEAWASQQKLSVQSLREQLNQSHHLDGKPCGLGEWAKCRGVSVGDFPESKDNIVRVRSKNEPYFYDQLWVKASWGAYRNPFRSWHRLRDRLLPEQDLKTLNADHVVSKGVLKALGAPNAWVLLFPVEAHANQFFGSLLEQKIAANPSLVSVDEIGLLSLFKVFSTKMPRASSEVDDSLNDVRLQLRQSSVDFPRMKQLLLQLMTFNKSG